MYENARVLIHSYLRNNLDQLFDEKQLQQAYLLPLRATTEIPIPSSELLHAFFELVNNSRWRYKRRSHVTRVYNHSV